VYTVYKKCLMTGEEERDGEAREKEVLNIKLCQMLGLSERFFFD